MMTRAERWILIMVGVLLCVVAAWPAAAQQHCGPRSEIMAKLSHDFRELPQVIGREQAGHVIEVWAGQDGTWTIVRYFASGRCCIVMHGDSFSRLKAAFGEPL